jgi:AI-2 transport protein TqsA
MKADGAPRISAGIAAAVLLLVAVYYGTEVLAPLTLAFFIIAIVWPLQQRLQLRLPALIALAITIIVTAVVCLGFASLAALAFGRVGRSLVADASRYQALYDTMVAWLEDRGVSVAGLWAEHFNTGWLLRAARQVTGRVNTTLTFWLVTLVYVMLGLLEVDNARRKVQALGNRDAARILIDATAATAVKVSKIHAGQDADERRDGLAHLGARLDHRASVCFRVGNHRVRAQLHSLYRPSHRDAVSNPA